MEWFIFPFLTSSALPGKREAKTRSGRKQKWPICSGSKGHCLGKERWEAECHDPGKKCTAKPKIKGNGCYQKAVPKELVLGVLE